jgi:Arc/MetJ-type ribon-helix-helix transcriptional regulator
MESVTINLSKSQRAFIEAQMAEGRIRSVSKYFDTLLRAERRRKAEERLVQLVKEADESGPPTPMTREDWDELKRRVWQREAQAKETPRGQGRQKGSRRVRS